MGDNYKKIDLDVHYDTENNDIASEFYNKVFEITHEYKRAVAYFDSASLMIILDGVRSLVNNNCKIFFLVSPQISDKDIDAIEKGYKSRNDIADEIFLNDFEGVSGNQYNVLAWLIYKKIVEIKIVFRVDNGPGIFHEKLGIIKDMDGEVVGEHIGLMHYTLGQRRGLDLGGIIGGNGGRWFVVEKDIKNNILYVSQGEHPKMFTNGLITYNMHWITGTPEEEVFECKAKFRYRQPDQEVKVLRQKNGHVKVFFKSKQRAITPGQWVVLYDNNICLGGGIIEETIA